MECTRKKDLQSEIRRPDDAKPLSDRFGKQEFCEVFWVLLRKISKHFLQQRRHNRFDFRIFETVCSDIVHTFVENGSFFILTEKVEYLLVHIRWHRFTESLDNSSHVVACVIVWACSCERVRVFVWACSCVSAWACSRVRVFVCERVRVMYCTTGYYSQSLF